MIYPRLIAEQLCKTPIRVVLYGPGLNEDGGPEVIFEKRLSCNYQSAGKTVLTADKKLVQLSGICFFHEDFCPGTPEISGGFAEVFDKKRSIHQGIKARNPDGTVNYVELRLM